MEGKHPLTIFNTLLAIVVFILIMLYASISFASGVQLILLIIPILTSMYYISEWVDEGALYPKLGKRLNLLLLFLFTLLPLFIGGYFYYTYYETIYLSWYERSLLDIIFATFILILVLEFSRREHPILFGIMVFFIIYCLPEVGKLLPEPFFHLGLPYLRIITSNTIEGQGVFGFLPLTGFYYVIPMLIFLGVVSRFGALTSLLRIVGAYVRRRSLLPPTCILSSAAIGVTTASITANVTVAGSFTIPTYKRLGFSPDHAGSIEVASSIGGLILPPIMSVVAFVMAGVIGVSYWEVVMHAWIIGLMYFTALITSVTLLFKRFATPSTQSQEVVSEDRRSIDKIVFLYFGAFILALAVIIYFLGVLGFEIPTAAYYGMITLLIYLFVVKMYEGLKRGLKTSLADYLKSFLHGVMEGVVDATHVMLLIATLGIMINVMTATGFLADVSWVLVKFSEASPWLLIITAYFLGILVGLGLPPTATYITLAILFVPVMVKTGFDFWAAQFFAFTVACLAEFSPPASVAAAAAARMSGGSFYRIMLIASFYSLPMWLFPFLCLFYPQIVYLTPEGFLMGFILLSACIGLTTRLLFIKQEISRISSTLLAANMILAVAIFITPQTTIQLICALLIWILLITAYMKIHPTKQQ